MQFESAWEEYKALQVVELELRELLSPHLVEELRPAQAMRPILRNHLAAIQKRRFALVQAIAESMATS